MVPLLSPLGIALHPVAALPGWALLERAGDHAHEPRIRRDSFTCGGSFDGGLQRLGETERDPPRELLAHAHLTRLRRLVRDDDELGVATGEPHFDPSGVDLA